MGDFEQIREISVMAVGKAGDELTFSFPEVLSVLKICDRNGIAVLGVELFEVGTDGYSTRRIAPYSFDQTAQDQLVATLNTKDWQDYVLCINYMAEEFIKRNPAGDEHVYILTACSRREFRDVEATRRASRIPEP